MPLNSYEDARNAILAHFTTAWNAQASPPLVIYDDKTQDLPDTAAYARITVQHNTAFQATLGGKPSQGGAGRRFRRNGLVTVQIFTPFGDGLTTSDPLVDLVVDALEGEETGSDQVEFKNVSVNEIGENGAWHQTNVTAEFEWDRVK